MTGMSTPLRITATTIITNAGTFILDAVVSESHSSPLRVTDNPIESGSVITDNAVLTPRPFEVSGVMVDYNPDETPLNRFMDSIHLRTPNFINEVAIPAQLKSITSQTIARVNRSIDMVGSAVSQLAGGQSGLSWLAKKFPNLLPPGVADMTVSDTRISDLYAALRSVQLQAQPVVIVTETTYYQNALILDVKVRVNIEGSAVFSISCKEVFIVDTKKAGGVKVPSDAAMGKTSGRTAAQTAKDENKGEVTPESTSPYAESTLSEADERAG
ncbi:phage baseplate protein [Lelliottia wanjuensis]|uniref:phage baseplate protein n=1 Tax=Lelliottia wanjuensis TaxID=3050585 RepID=UPI00254A7FBF|nr:hypothetical protein [Lelliottia sp. V104_15]MDK9607115.1 hypothetical protein [Lelliottia sp. V104_15]